MGLLDPKNIPMTNFTKKFGRDDQNPGELLQLYFKTAGIDL